MREQKHTQDDGQHEWTYRAATVYRFEAKVSGGEQPSKKRKRSK
jgi:hypothetical protein